MRLPTAQVTAWHGTPITPNALLEAICRTPEGVSIPRNFCVSYCRPDQIEAVDELAAFYFLDNGAFSAWQEAKRSGREVLFDSTYWGAYYDFVRTWLDRRASWFVIPDVINAGTQEQDALLRECPAELLPYGWPVWHMDEPVHRLLGLIERFERVCIGATPPYAVVGSADWRARMDDVFTQINQTFSALPLLHMLRGLQCLGPEFDYPLSGADSADVGRNHNRLKRKHGADRHFEKAILMTDRWDALAASRRRPATWIPPRQSLPGLDLQPAY